MKINKALLYIFNIIFCLSVIYSDIQAQDDWEDQPGEIEDAQVIIEKDVKIELPFANRNYRKIPPPALPKINEQLEYNYKTFIPELAPIKPVIRVLKVKTEPIPKIYGNYIKAGYGNFNTPLFEAVFNNKRSENYNYGALIKHKSSGKGPVDGRNSASGLTEVGLNGKYFHENISIYGDMGYKRTRQFFYGYPSGLEVERDSIEQIYNQFKVGIGLKNISVNESFQYQIKASYKNIQDNFEAQEGEFGIKIKSAYPINRESKIQINGDLFLISRKDSEVDLNRYLIRVNPVYEFMYNDIKIEAGINAVLENDTLDNFDKLHLYPEAEISYSFSQNLNVYAGFTGDIIKNTLNQLVYVNPYIDENVLIFNNNKEFDLYGGIRGAFMGSWSYKTGFSLSTINNMHFFINDSTDISRFNIIYDPGNTTRFNYFGELGFGKFQDVRINLRADIYAFNTDKVQVPWHKPGYKVSLDSKFNIYDKIRISGDLNLTGGIEALDPATDSSVNLDDIIWVGFNFDYNFSNRFSIFLNLENVISKKYERYFNYPSRSFQLLGGATYSF